jgi:hypothetical protein
MKLYIPTIGDELKLTADWTFDLYDEDRNSSLMEVLGDPRQGKGLYSRNLTALPATIRAGAILKVDRIYIRKGQDDFDSITFFWKDMRTESRIIQEDDWRTYDNRTQKCTQQKDVKIPRRPVRFWVKLPEANNIEFDKV